MTTPPPPATPGVVVDVWFVADGGSVSERFEADRVSLTNMRDRPTLYFRAGRVVDSPLGTGPVTSVSYADAPRVLVRPAAKRGKKRGKR